MPILARTISELEIIHRRVVPSTRQPGSPALRACYVIAAKMRSPQRYLEKSDGYYSSFGPLRLCGGLFRMLPGVFLAARLTTGGYEASASASLRSALSIRATSSAGTGALK